MESKGDHQKPPSEDQILVHKLIDLENKCMLITAKVTKPGWIIRSVIASSEALFPGTGVHIVQPLGGAQAPNEVSLQVRSHKFSEETMQLQILLGAGYNAPHFLINEREVKIRRWEFFRPLSTQELMF
jgi:hypothetical protein